MSRPMYCLACHYDLRGLTEHRCPECGRPFAPGSPRSFSPTPRPEPLRRWVRQASTLLSEAVSALEPTDPVARAMLPLRRQVGRLSAENFELRQQVAALTRVLLDHGLITPAELDAAVIAAPPELAIVDDTAATVDDELLDLHRAVADRQDPG